MVTPGGVVVRGVVHTAAFVFLLSIPLLSPGCLPSSPLDQADAGKTSSYQAGSPGFDIEMVQVHGDSISAVDLFLSIPFPSLIFEKTEGGFRSRAEIIVRLSDRATGQLVQEVSWPETTSVDRYETTQSFEPKVIRKRIGMLPGAYRTDVTLEDMIDGRKGTRTQGVVIMDPSGLGPALGRITLLDKKSDGTTLPQISFFVPLRADSMGCTLGMYNFPSDFDSRVDMRVLRYSTDTAVALAPFYYSILPIPLGHSLIDFDRPDTVFRTLQGLRVVHRDESPEFHIPPLKQGMYRIEFAAATRTPQGTDTLLAAARYYSVKGPGFPRPVTYKELIDAAVYIATEKEMKALRSARGQEEQRKKFEEFWLSFAGDPARASALIKKYYGRVEEANRLFTIVREGWSTDRGMLYCVLGPPAEVANHLDTQTWYYDLTGNVPDNTYVFKRIIRSGEGLSVEDYILYRQGGYEIFWTRMVARWRRGEPL
jgi:GWxTD domain-containing protein